MKRWMRLLALALALCMLMSSALAADAVLPAAVGEGFGTVNRWAVAGDTLYLLAKNHFFRWEEGMPQAEEILCPLVSSNYADPEDESVLPVSGLFSDEAGQLYGLNHFTGGVFTINVTQEGVVCEDIATISNISALYTTADNPNTFSKSQSAALAGDWLVWLKGSRELLMFNLEKDTAKRSIWADVWSMCPYQDGKVLIVRGSQPYQVYVFDPETDEAVPFCRLPKDCYNYSITYHAASGLVIYLNGTRIMGIRPGEEARQVGFIAREGVNGQATLGDSYLWISGTEVLACGIAEGFTTEHAVNMLDMSAPIAFNEKYPDVPYYSLYRNDLDGEYRDLLASGEYAIDLVQFRCEPRSEDFYQLMEEGMLMDLSASPAIAAYVADLYPAFRDAVMLDGAIYGVPVYAYGYDGWYINKKVMQEMGLTAADIPTSLTELCAFATRWNDEWVDKYPQYTLIDVTENYRERMLDVMMNMYITWRQKNGEPITYDAPVFRELLAALETMQVDKLDANQRVTNPEQSDYKQALLWTGCRAVGNWSSYMEESSDRIFIPMTLTPDTDYAAAVTEMNVLAMNVASQNQEYALAMIEDVLAAMDARYATVLRMSFTEPLESEYWGNYAGKITMLQEEIAQIEAGRAESPEWAEAAIAQREAEMARITAEHRYVISPSAIENYVQVIAPAMVVRRSDATTHMYYRPAGEQMAAYLAGGMDVDAFIASLDAMLSK